MQPGEGPSRGLLRDYEPSDGTFNHLDELVLVVVGEDGDAEVAVLSEQRGPLQLGAHGHGVTVMGDCAGAGAAS